MLAVKSLSMFSIANAFKQLLLIIDLKYVFIHLYVENEHFEVQFVADAHINICSTMST